MAERMVNTTSWKIPPPFSCPVAWAKRTMERLPKKKLLVHILELNRDAVFADAVYAINKSPQQSLRMPEQMGDEHDVKKIATHRETDPGPFRWLRANDPLTLRWTARCYLQQTNSFQRAQGRGANPPENYKLGRCTGKSRVDALEEYEKKLFKAKLIAYQIGKGNQLVPSGLCVRV